MSRYRKFAEELDNLARAKFKAYTDAESKLRSAELQRKALPDYASQLQRVEADYEVENAKRGLETAKLALENVTDEVDEIRSRLADAVFEGYAADPAKVDTKTLALLESGILNVDEYKHIISQAKATNNSAMIRLAGKYAMSAASAAEKEYGADHPKARELREVGLLSEVIDTKGEHIMNSFDVLASTLTTTAKNAAMIGDWDSLTADVIESF